MLHASLSRSAFFLVFAAAFAVGTGPANAQMGGAFDPGTLMRQGAKSAPDTTKPPTVQPPALPGASSKADNVAPATKLPTDMSPNDALFDAINRGDIGAARDALNRGAQLSAQNVLGMTPLELSVDLGRNDISFLLLSFRGSDSSDTAQPRVAGAAPPAAAGQTGQKGAPAQKAAAAKPARHGAVVPVKDVVPAPAPRTPRLFADDGGTPAPKDGFLGFNAGRSAH